MDPTIQGEREQPDDAGAGTSESQNSFPSHSLGNFDGCVTSLGTVTIVEYSNTYRRQFPVSFEGGIGLCGL